MYLRFWMAALQISSFWVYSLPPLSSGEGQCPLANTAHSGYGWRQRCSHTPSDSFKELTSFDLKSGCL